MSKAYNLETVFPVGLAWKGKVNDGTRWVVLLDSDGNEIAYAPETTMTKLAEVQAFANHGVQACNLKAGDIYKGEMEIADVGQ